MRRYTSSTRFTLQQYGVDLNIKQVASGLRYSLFGRLDFLSHRRFKVSATDGLTIDDGNLNWTTRNHRCNWRWSNGGLGRLRVSCSSGSGSPCRVAASGLSR